MQETSSFVLEKMISDDFTIDQINEFYWVLKERLAGQNGLGLSFGVSTIVGQYLDNA